GRTRKPVARLVFARLPCLPAWHLRRPALPALSAIPLRVLRSISVMVVNEATEPGAEDPEIPAGPAPPIQSRFLFVDVAALRAKQLRRGARPRVGTDEGPLPHKAER